MKPFIQVATPHEDVLEGRLTMDVFAADLWQVIEGVAPIDYQDPEIFFKKTYLTKGLKNILEVAEARLKGKGGDPIVQLQTPFGGGKTHALIALYHKAREWGAKVFAFDGLAVNPKQVKPWEELERQLTGKVEVTKGDIPPGKEVLVKLISENSPLLILIDEVLAYATKAAGIKVGDSNLAAQTLAFIQELTAAVSLLDNSFLVVTLPSSVLEHYDENAEKMFHQLQKVLGRMEKIYTPVEDDEIEHVVRHRLFSKVDEKEMKKVVNDFIEYARDEGLITEEEINIYRERFLRSYPFKPEVIDILYKRWGSFPSFQRTRGVLRLLSLVVYSLLNKNVPFIRLGDFDLGNDEIKRELIKHIGQEWDSIIAQDITSPDSGAKKVDRGLKSSYRPYNLGTVVSTTIFMMSFSGRGERGSSVRDIKLSTVYPEFSSTIIDSVITELREKLFYLSDEGLYFTNQPNINRMILILEESVTEDKLYETELEILRKHVSSSPRLKVYIHPKFSRDIPDTPDLKLIIMNKDEPDLEFIEKHGEIPRVYRNTLIFLCGDENYRENFLSFLRKLIALKQIDKQDLRLTLSQRNEVANKIKMYVRREHEELRKLYRKIYVPIREGLKKLDMGLPIFGERYLDREVYDILRTEGELLESLSPLVIKEKYLADNDYIETKKLYEALSKTPGELRVLSENVVKQSIKEGVKSGLFGLGSVKDGKVECRSINEHTEVYLTDGEIIVKPEFCIKPREEGLSEEIEWKEPIQKETRDIIEKEYIVEKYSKLKLKLKVPVGQISTIARLVNFLKSRFEQCDIEVSIITDKGHVTITEYENIIKEALIQGKIEVIEENKE